jgi:hypothetical protein
MATYDGKSKSIETKIKLLTLTDEESKGIIDKEQVSSLERQQKVIKTKLDEVYNLKVEIKELKLESNEDEEEIRDWSAGIDSRVVVFEENIAKLESVIKELNREALKQTKHDEEEFIQFMKHKQFEKEMQFEEEKFQRRMAYEKKIEEARQAQGSTKEKSNLNTKLPKLVISKFNGELTDWLRFWNQFQAEIEAAEIPVVTKFSYLKELLEAKVRVCIDGLPLTSEGYERAKNILKSKYGKDSEIVNAYIQNIMLLPRIQGSNTKEIHQFYEKLLWNVQALETLGKLKEITGYVRMTIDKLGGIRGDLVRTDDAWQEWKFPELIEALRQWTVRNPISSDEKNYEKNPKKSKSFQTDQRDPKPTPCVYCEKTDHKPAECTSVVTVADRKKILSTKQRCFNCTGQKHKASECRSQLACRRCKRRHHTSICESQSPLLVATGEGAVTYPVVVVDVDGIRCRALLDTGAGSSYASATLLALLNKQPVRKEYRRIEMMMQTSTKMIEVHKIKINSVEENFNLETEVTKVDRDVLLHLNNPRYKEMIAKYPHLKAISMQDVDNKPELPVHLILGTSEYARIKTGTPPRIGKPGQPVAELTRFGWTLISPGKEVDLTNMFLTQTSTMDYENLCKLDVLGLKDSPEGDQQSVYDEFKEQLIRRPDGSYETGLPWKGCHPPLHSNEMGSLRRLNNLVKKLEKQPGILEKYDDVIQNQLSQGIVEKATAKGVGRVFYIPHKPVFRESAESTKLRIVYQASARGNEKAPSLNECLETGPSLQNLLWSVLVRNRFYPVAIAGDLKQAFLQIWIKAEDRDAMRFHWYEDLETKKVQTLRFTRALFGLAPSPFLLGGVVEQHLQLCQRRFPAEVEEIKRNLYVDDLIGGGETSTKALHLKETAQTIFGEANFELHKWHSNDPNLEKANKPSLDQEQSYAKEQLGTKQAETKLLGLPWTKTEDTIAVKVSQSKAEPTKRGLLGTLARIYDPLGLASPITLNGKLLYRDVCSIQKSWDKQIPHPLLNRWLSWEESLPDHVTVPRSLVKNREEIKEIQLHAFGDASGKGVSTVVYAVIRQPSGTSQGLITSKSRLAKQGLTIPRQELVSAHMSCNLIHNVKEVLTGFSVSNVYGWLDSTVALHWISGKGEYKQFVRNRVSKIQEKQYIQWRHVPTAENPADVGSRGGSIDQLSKL